MGPFITFEGPDGSGKTTQIQMLAGWLRWCGMDVLTTREPGGTHIGDAVRNILLDPARVEMQHQTEILLYSAARAQLVGEVIIPHLENGGVVLCDRFADSTLAYQGHGRQLDLDVLRRITAFATRSLVPDLTIYLDLPVVEGLLRKRGGDEGEWNRIEREEVAFHERVRQGYLKLIQSDPGRWLVLPAQSPIEEIQKSIREQVARRLKLTGGA